MKSALSFQCECVDSCGRRCSFLRPIQLSACVFICMCVFVHSWVCILVHHWFVQQLHFMLTSLNKHTLTRHQYKQQTTFFFFLFLYLILCCSFSLCTHDYKHTHTHTHTHTHKLGSCLERAAERKRPTHEVSRRLALPPVFTVNDEQTHIHTRTQPAVPFPLLTVSFSV